MEVQTMASTLFQSNQNQNSPMMNPQVRQIMSLVNQSGMSAKDLFYQKAKEMGISDPNEFLRQNGFTINNV